MPGPPAPMPPARTGCTVWASSSASLQAAWAPGLGSGPRGEKGFISRPHQTLEGGRMDGLGGWGHPSKREREGQGLGPRAWLQQGVEATWPGSRQ